MTKANKDSLTSLFLVLESFILSFFLNLFVLSRTSNVMLNGSEKSQFSLSPLSAVSVRFLFIDTICQFKDLSERYCLHHMIFSAFIEMIMQLLSLF